MTKILEELAPKILEEIKKANSVLLHCHPKADADSVGSSLGMKFILESLGKKVTVIQGDTEIPEAFMHFPGATLIADKNFSQINPKDFDLFIVLDCRSADRISSLPIPQLPLPMRTIVIDHHEGAGDFAFITLSDTSYPATAQMVYELAKKWSVNLTHDMALNLILGIYTDTGGLKYSPTSRDTFTAAGELAQFAPDYHEAISIMFNSKRKESVVYEGLALASMKTYFDDRIAITAVSFDEISEHSIMAQDVSATPIPNILISVKQFQVGISLSEREPGVVSLSSRSKNVEKFDVEKLTKALGGGGHKAAAGARLPMTLDQAIAKVVETAKMLYNL